MATLYGQDSFCLTDIGLVDVQVTDPRQLIGQRIARRLQTPRGGLAAVGDDADFGFNIRSLINARIRPADLGTWRHQIESEVVKDEQVQSCAVTMKYSGTVLTISLRVDTAAGPFSLTIDVGKLTVDAIFRAL